MKSTKSKTTSHIISTNTYYLETLIPSAKPTVRTPSEDFPPNPLRTTPSAHLTTYLGRLSYRVATINIRLHDYRHLTIRYHVDTTAGCKVSAVLISCMPEGGNGIYP